MIPRGYLAGRAVSGGSRNQGVLIVLRNVSRVQDWAPERAGEMPIAMVHVELRLRELSPAFPLQRLALAPIPPAPCFAFASSLHWFCVQIALRTSLGGFVSSLHSAYHLVDQTVPERYIAHSPLHPCLPPVYPTPPPVLPAPLPPDCPRRHFTFFLDGKGREGGKKWVDGKTPRSGKMASLTPDGPYRESAD